jgi:hypothetical protein
MDATQTQYDILAEEADLPVYIRTFKLLKDSFRTPAHFVILHADYDLWEVRLIGVTSREWLEFCANVFAELPSETVDLVEEAVLPAPELDPNWPENRFEQTDVEDNQPEEELEEEELEDEAAEEEVEDDEEVEEDDTVNSDGESPSKEVQRKLRKATLVRKTGNSAVTVEQD